MLIRSVSDLCRVILDGIHVAKAKKRQTADTEQWCTVECVEAGHSINYVSLFLGVHHSVISRLWKLFQTSQTAVRRSLPGRPRIATALTVSISL